MQLERAKIRASGCGGFLNPPTHPEHNFSVVSTRKDDFFMSLSSAAICGYIIMSVKEEAQAKLDAWVRPDLDSDEIQDWIHRVLGYFNDCYSPDGINRTVTDCLTRNGNPFEVGIHRHLGVLFILQYYPEYEPRGVDFINAYWGKKPEKVVPLDYDNVQEFEVGSKWVRNKIVYVVSSTTAMMVMYFDESDTKPNPTIHKDTKWAFGLINKEYK